MLLQEGIIDAIFTSFVISFEQIDNSLGFTSTPISCSSEEMSKGGSIFIGGSISIYLFYSYSIFWLWLKSNVFIVSINFIALLFFLVSSLLGVSFVPMLSVP